MIAWPNSYVVKHQGQYKLFVLKFDLHSTYASKNERNNIFSQQKRRWKEFVELSLMLLLGEEVKFEDFANSRIPPQVRNKKRAGNEMWSLL